MSYKEKVFLAREFRKKPTKSEDIFWQTIRRKKILGYRFRRQHIIEGFIVDFYCPKLKLVIEIDGGIHIVNHKEDKERMCILKNTGIVFFRIQADLVENNLEFFVDKLKSFIKDMPGWHLKRQKPVEK